MTIVPARLVAFPIAVTAYELQMGDKRVPKPEWEERIEEGIDAQLEKILEGRGRFPSAEEWGACGDSCRALSRWAVNASMQIAAQKTGHGTYGKGWSSVTGWRNPADLSSVRQALNADFALVMAFRDAHESTGRAVLGVFAGVNTYYKQVGVACVLNLVTGRMAWCDARSDAWWDLRDPERASVAVWELLTELYNLPPRPEAPRPAQKR